jgi:hypothetical protein
MPVMQRLLKRNSLRQQNPMFSATEVPAINPFLKKLESVNITKAYFKGVSNTQQ